MSLKITVTKTYDENSYQKILKFTIDKVSKNDIWVASTTIFSKDGKTIRLGDETPLDDRTDTLILKVPNDTNIDELIKHVIEEAQKSYTEIFDYLIEWISKDKVREYNIDETYPDSSNQEQTLKLKLRVEKSYDWRNYARLLYITIDYVSTTQNIPLTTKLFDDKGYIRQISDGVLFPSKNATNSVKLFLGLNDKEENVIKVQIEAIKNAYLNIIKFINDWHKNAEQTFIIEI
jgi:hypothetical protein